MRFGIEVGLLHLELAKKLIEGVEALFQRIVEDAE